MIVVNLLNLFNEKNVDGVGHYTINLFKGMNEISELGRFHFIIRRNSLAFFSEILDNMAYTLVEEPMFINYDFYKKDFLAKLYLEQIIFPEILKKLDVNIVFNPFHSITSYVSSTVPTVVTYHDLLHLNHKGNMQLLKRIFSVIKHRQIIKKTAFFIVPSQYVKEDLIKNYPTINKEKITVLPNPIHIDKSETLEYKIDKKYILSVNTLDPHKNLITLLKSFYLIKDEIDCNLVLVGKPGQNMNSELTEFIEKIGKNRLIITGYVSNAERNYLYKNAALFVSPSLHEGFGMTPIEASMFNIPVLTTKVTSLYEITKGVLNYYDPPEDYQALSNKILEIIKSRDYENIETSSFFDELYGYRKAAKEYIDFFNYIEDQV